MSLATRCTACGTVFRVVQDQLKVSEGWVRCGRCHEVFNALEGLFDLQREAPPAWPPPAPQPPSIEPPPVAGGTAPTAGLETRPLLGARDSESPPDFADARFPSELPTEVPTEGPSDVPRDDAAAPTEAVADSEPAPQFVRAAELAERWQRPRVRASLALLALLLACALVVQAALHFRDPLAAGWPATRPLVAALCDVAGCRIGPPRRLEQIAVDASGLVRVEGDALYRLEVVLRNRGRRDVLVPALDLTLTDIQGQLVARKVLGADQLGASTTSLAGGAELPLQAVIATGGRRVAGYTVEVFYP